MGWKRITNKKKQQKDVMPKLTGKMAEYVIPEETIRQYLIDLLPEWNFRMLTDAQKSTDMVLWVDSVTVTAYLYTPKTKSFGILRFLNLFRKSRKGLMGKRG